MKLSPRLRTATKLGLRSATFGLIVVLFGYVVWEQLTTSSRGTFREIPPADTPVVVWRIALPADVDTARAAAEVANGDVVVALGRSFGDKRAHSVRHPIRFIRFGPEGQIVADTAGAPPPARCASGASCALTDIAIDANDSTRVLIAEEWSSNHTSPVQRLLSLEQSRASIEVDDVADGLLVRAVRHAGEGVRWVAADAASPAWFAKISRREARADDCAIPTSHPGFRLTVAPGLRSTGPLRDHRVTGDSHCLVLTGAWSTDRDVWSDPYHFIRLDAAAYDLHGKIQRRVIVPERMPVAECGLMLGQRTLLHVDRAWLKFNEIADRWWVPRGFLSRSTIYIGKVPGREERSFSSGLNMPFNPIVLMYGDYQCVALRQRNHRAVAFGWNPFQSDVIAIPDPTAPQPSWSWDYSRVHLIDANPRTSFVGFGESADIRWRLDLEGVRWSTLLAGGDLLVAQIDYDKPEIVTLIRYKTP